MIRFLTVLFILLILGRFYFPFVFHPLDHTFSDALRHWEHGKRLLNPELMGSIDPKLYQLWMWVVRHIGEDRITVGIFSGLLCAATPYSWYRAAREILSSKILALVFGILIAIHPSFLAFYGYFMPITLLLPLSGFALWLTFRAYRKPGVSSFILAATVWLFAVLTKPILAPLGLCMLGYIWIKHNQKLTKAAISMVLLVSTLIPAAWHSYQNLYFYAPLGAHELNRVYVLSGSIGHRYETPYGTWIFSSPSFHHNPFSPFDEYNSKRSRAEPFPIATINTHHGRTDWTHQIEAYKQHYNWKQWLEDKIDYTVFFFSGASWPDSQMKGGHITKQAAYWSRWMWAPLVFILIVGALSVSVRPRPLVWMIVWGSLALILWMIFQNLVIIEGRYRKPLEPLLLLSMAIVWEAWQQRRAPHKQ